MSDEIRSAEIHRKTAETEILLQLELDGTGSYQIDTEMPFLGHMLALFAMHSLSNLKVWARGDTEVDNHHTVEDIGLCFGLALKQAIGDKKGVRRYGCATVPMDEALARVVVDLSGRPYLSYSVSVPCERVGNFPAELVEEFFRAVVNSAGITLHIDLLRGANSHHILEAVFKAFARAVKDAVEYEPRVEGVWSTKGKL